MDKKEIEYQERPILTREEIIRRLTLGVEYMAYSKADSAKMLKISQKSLERRLR